VGCFALLLQLKFFFCEASLAAQHPEGREEGGRGEKLIHHFSFARLLRLSTGRSKWGQQQHSTPQHLNSLLLQLPFAVTK
jgi:hypothetical protein